ARTFTYTVCIYRLTFSRRDQLFIQIVRYTVTIRIQRAAVAVNSYAFRSAGAFVELVCDTVTVCVRQDRLRQFHMTRSAQFAIHVIQRIQPVQRLYMFLAAEVEIQAQ